MTFVEETPEYDYDLVASRALNQQLAIQDALVLIYRYGGIDGSHHKQWVLDQVLRILTGSDEKYKAWCENYRGDWDEENEEYEYGEWDVGIAP